MGRIRTIKPEFFRHEELFEAEKKSGLPLRVAFAGLFTIADREGRFKWKPKEIKFDVLPFDDVDMELVLSFLWETGFIRRYTVDGKDFAVIPSFKNHQVINNREGKSNLPPEPEKNVFRKDASFTRAPAASGERKEGKGREGNIHKAVCESIAEIFGRDWEPDAQNRMPDLFPWYREVESQASILIRNYSPPEIAAKQVRAYIKHCRDNKRKLIGLVYKVSETVLSSDWVNLNAPDPPPKKAEQFSEAERNKDLWTETAWLEFYAKQIRENEQFRKHFKINPTPAK
jgi:hypothetical protein